VCGTETEDIPVIPLWNHFKNNHEILRIGTIFQMDDKSKIHLHAALARRNKVLMGCLREKSIVFLLEEIIIFELLGIEVSREKNGRTGLPILRL
jgi:predicted DNA-binding protein with PD1-like motif